MYKCINGWTKERMIAQIKLKNDDTKAVPKGAEGLSGAGCMYKTESGNRCAVGCFIPDGHISLDDYDANYANNLLADYSDLVPLMPLETQGLLELQHVHDTSFKQSIHAILTNWLDANVE